MLCLAVGGWLERGGHNSAAGDLPRAVSGFFGALRAATYDNQIRRWIREEVVKADITDEDANMRELSRRLINQ